MTAVPKGDIAIADIESLTHEGHGVAHIDGKAVFIHGALPGERVRFRYYNKRAKFDTGTVVEVLQATPARIAQPRCEYFGVCGGCGLQHLDSAAQLRAKEKILLDNLAHIAKLTPASVLPPLAGPAWHYRRKARLGARVVPKKGGVLIGFREKRSSYITNLAHCETLDARVSALLPTLRELLSRLSCADRIPQIEVAVGDATVMLVFRHLVPLNAADITQLREFGSVHTVQIGLQPGDPRTIETIWPNPPASLYYDLPAYNLRLFFAPTDFIQVNAAMNAAMIAAAIALLEVAPHERVLDLFCGLGNFSLALARHAAQVLGVEGDAALVARAQANARYNGLPNIEFRSADLFNEAAVAALWPPAGDRSLWHKLLLDPPRTGAVEVVKSIPDHGPRRIVYVSCNPATLARDAEILVHAKGYRLQSAGVMDMFPQTTHVESIACFEKP